MLAGIKHYFRPENISDFQDMSREYSGRFRVLAGGTAINRFFQPSASRDVLIDIRNMGLNKISIESGVFRIGATVTINELIHFMRDFCQDGHFGRALIALGRACSTIASEPLRNLITVGGNLTHLFPWSDLPPVLAVMDAEIELNCGSRLCSYSDYLKSISSNSVDAGELVTSILISLPDGISDFRTAFYKYSTTTFDFASMNVSVCAHFSAAADSLSKLTLGIGGIGRIPRIFDLTEYVIHKSGEAISLDPEVQADELAGVVMSLFEIRNMRAFSDREIMASVAREIITRQIAEVLL
ncbi:MAG: hypothetical protein CVV64_03925 [Candidatus Wallbacteria bacterium HGW-Wallbacteria-1]|jgi:CO/xanthine dehydrogenase FAD-binding subunit|uniref:FAD-binding PCMH-type domain-containing protein n=1 Tax=Candidatus Wallbacteria bacterium HGW-Wallbacteria-1 TaxID=2013854 RepID=A0A2N1PRH1_9BACT|nr:MAG: hypothetical protein CVV64_03925 [Candidatus Wallbacteria bacterium HGW-Wallbacteria-1]